MKRAPRKLEIWQRQHGFTDAEAGAHFRTTRMTWLRWKRGEMVPSPNFMILLFVEGVAEPNDFYDLPENVTRRAAA